MPNKETLTEKFKGHTPGPWTVDEIRTVSHELGRRDVVGPSPTHPGKFRVVAEDVRLEDAPLLAAAPDLLRERDALRAKLDDLATADEHIAECQEKLGEAGVEPGADGSVVVGIVRLADERDEARRQRDALAKEVAAEVDTVEVYLAQGTLSAIAGPLVRIRAALAKAGRS